MENLAEEKEEINAPKLIVTEDMRSYIYETAKWANFLAIIGFVFATFMVIGAFAIGPAMNTNPELAKTLGPVAALGSVGLTITYLVLSFGVFYPSLLMFKYTVKAKLGVLYGEQESLNEALGKIKSLFKYWGILAILFISLYVIGIVLSIISAVAA